MPDNFPPILNPPKTVIRERIALVRRYLDE